jgi:hypothetical protein
MDELELYIDVNNIWAEPIVVICWKLLNNFLVGDGGRWSWL